MRLAMSLTGLCLFASVASAVREPPKATPRPTPLSFADVCNQKIKTAIVASAKSKCEGDVFDFYWSERELDVSSKGVIAGGFAFRCRDGDRYLGLIKASTNTCALSKPTIARTSEVKTKL